MELEQLLNHENGRRLFMDFLRKEFSQENLEFWLECQRLKMAPKNEPKLIKKIIRTIYDQYVSLSGPKAINIDGTTLKMIKDNLAEPRPEIFMAAERQIFDLMKNDSYPRFLQSNQYKTFLKLAQNGGRKRKILKPSSQSMKDSSNSERLSLSRSDSLSANQPDNFMVRNFHAPAQQRRWPEVQRFIRVILPDGSQHLVPAVQDSLVTAVVQDLLQKQGLDYSHFKLFSVHSQEEIDLYQSVSTVRATEIRVEPFVLFSLHFPEGYQVCVETNRNQLAYYAINTILTKFGIEINDVELSAASLGVLCRNSLMRAAAILDGAIVQVNYFSSLRTFVDLGDFNDLNQDSDVTIRSIKYKKRHQSHDTLSIDCVNSKIETKMQPFYENYRPMESEKNVLDLGNLSFSNEMKTEEFLNNILAGDPSQMDFTCTPKKTTDDLEPCYENVPPKSERKTLHRAKLAIIEDDDEQDEEPFYENQEVIKRQNLNPNPPEIKPFSKYLCQNKKFDGCGRKPSLTRNSPSRKSIRPLKRLQPDLILSSTTHRTCPPIKTLSRFHKVE